MYLLKLIFAGIYLISVLEYIEGVLIALHTARI